MIAVPIILGILLALFLISQIRIHVFGEYCNTIRLYAKVGPITLHLVDGDWVSSMLKDHSAKDKWKAKRELENRKKQGNHPNETEEKPKFSKQDWNHLIAQIKSMVVDILRYLKNYLYLNELTIRILAATGDADKTAELYGTVCSLLASLESELSKIPEKRMQREHIQLKAECDFVAEEPEIDFYLHISLRVWQGIIVWRWYSREIIKLWEAQEGSSNINERKDNNGNIHETAS